MANAPLDAPQEGRLDFMFAFGFVEPAFAFLARNCPFASRRPLKTGPRHSDASLQYSSTENSEDPFKSASRRVQSPEPQTKEVAEFLVEKIRAVAI